MSTRSKSLLVALLVAVTGPANAFDETSAARVIDLAKTKLAATASRTSPTEYPKYTGPDGRWVTVSNGAMLDWTQGFFPGCLWWTFEASGDATLRTRAESWTANLELQKTNTQTHDLGFKFVPSFGQAYRLTQRAQDKDVLLTAAASLATRYDAKVGVITTGDWNPAWRAPMVIDTMMNLELLLWAAQNGGKPEWREMAVSHALKTLSDLIRADGSSFQVVDYEPTTGQIRSRGTYQGYSDSSTWSRGQAWAIYGFTMVYRYTRDPRMLDAARKVTDYYLGRLPQDLVPKWDLDAPDETKDSSTAAAVASALLELSGFVDPTTGARYRDVALRTLDSLASPAYLAEGTNRDGLLLHGTGDHPAKQGIDASLIYGDYYFLEAVLRARALGAPAAPAPSGAAPVETDAGTPPSPQPSGATSPPETGGCSEGIAAGSFMAALLLAALIVRRRGAR